MRTVIEKTESSSRRGTRSFRERVRSPKIGKCCTLKRHCRGALRQVVGYAELLAGRDRERFIFASRQDFLDHAKNFRTGMKYRQRQVDSCISIAESMGILTPARRERNDAIRNGFLVARHDDLSSQYSQIHCEIHLDFHGYSPKRNRGNRRLSAIPLDARVQLNEAESAIPSAIQSVAECNSNSTQTINNATICEIRSNVLAAPSPLEPSLSPSKPSPAHECAEGSLRSPAGSATVCEKIPDEKPIIRCAINLLKPGQWERLMDARKAARKETDAEGIAKKILDIHSQGQNASQVIEDHIIKIGAR